MAPNKTKIWRNEFTYDETSNHSTCKHSSGKCPTVKGTHNTNLKKHLEAAHYPLFKKLKKLEEDENTHSEKNANDITKYGTIIKPAREEKIQITTSFRRILMNVVKQIVIHGRPLKYITDAATQDQIKPSLNALLYVPFTINQENVKRFIHLLVEEMKQQLLKQTQDSVICLKLDGATCQERNFLGVNVQYRIKAHLGDVKIYTLGCIELHKSSTSVNLTEEILKCVKSYGFDLNRIVTITTDNGANYKKTTEIVNKEINDLSNASATPSSSISNRCDTNNNTPDDPEDYDYTIDEILVEEIDESEFELHSIIDKLKADGFASESVIGVSCAAHTYQLAIHDWFKSLSNLTESSKSNLYNDNVFDIDDDPDEFNSDCTDEEEDGRNMRKLSLLDKVRTIVKKLRTNKFKLELKKLHVISSFPLDCATRWSSQYDMMHVFIKHKKEIASLEHLLPAKTKLSKNDWKDLSTMYSVLRHCYYTTKKLQDPQITLSEIYLLFVDNIRQMDIINSVCALSLKRFIEARLEKLLVSPAFLGAIFLDPSCKGQLSTVQQGKAITYLKNLFKKVRIVSASTLEVPEFPSSDEPPSNSTSEENEVNGRKRKTKNALDEYLKQRSGEVGEVDDIDGDEDKVEKEFDVQLSAYKLEAFKSTEISPVDYWLDIFSKKRYMLLSEVVAAVFSIPGTQVTVERLFSYLNLVLNPIRNRLLGINVENILLLKSNFDLIERDEELCWQVIEGMKTAPKKK